MSLPIVWFVIVAFFWTGFFVLEGFDFGVGALHTFVGRTDTERRVAINTIGPFWDGNEVWLVVAGAAMFAAFPAWYATWFSALYLALLLLLVGADHPRRVVRVPGQVRTAALASAPGAWTLTIGQRAASRCSFGIALGDLLSGLPSTRRQYTGNFCDLLTPYGLWVGLTLLSLTLLHGSTFLTLRTTGIVYERARLLATAVLVHRDRHGDRLHDLDAGALAPRRHPGAAAGDPDHRGRRGWVVGS